MIGSIELRHQFVRSVPNEFGILRIRLSVLIAALVSSAKDQRVLTAKNTKKYELEVSSFFTSLKLVHLMLVHLMLDHLMLDHLKLVHLMLAHLKIVHSKLDSFDVSSFKVSSF